MFPIAHAWLLEQLVPQPTPAHYLGCVWPDMLFGSPLTHPQSHRSGAQLATFARSLPDTTDADIFRAFVVGVLTHGSEPSGFDWYSDEQYGEQSIEARGYAFQRGLPLAASAARACDLAERHGWWKAHNLIEMAFEPMFYMSQPALGERLLALRDNTALIENVTRRLAVFFQQPAADLVPSIQQFFTITQLRPTSAASLASSYAMQTRLKHPGAHPDEAAISALITQAEEIIALDRDQFLAGCVARVGAMLREVM